MRLRFLGGMPTSLSSWLFAGSLATAPINDLKVAEHVSVADVFFICAVLAALAERMYLKERIRILPAYVAGIAILFLCYLVNDVGKSGDELESFLIIVTMLILLPQAMLLLRIKDQQEMKWLICIWSIGGLVGAFFVVLYCNGYFPSHVDEYWRWNHRARGLTQHPNRVGLNCYLTLPGLLLMLASMRSFVGKAVIVTLICVVLKAIDYSGSRAGMIAAFVVLGVWAALHAREIVKSGGLRRRQAVVLLAWLMGLVGVGIYTLAGSELPLLQDTLTRLIQGDMRSDMIRADLNDRAWRGFFANPIFGEGYTWFGVFHPDVAHNVYIQYLQAVGSLGFGVFILVMLYPLIYPVRKQLTHPDRSIVTLNISLLAAAFAILVWLKPQSGFTDFQAMNVFGMLLYISVWRLYDKEPVRYEQTHTIKTAMAVTRRAWPLHMRLRRTR